ncbi:hypothetical protein AM391_RS23665 [Kluyvera ascorbata]|nr:hypothetical protein [Kluyvera ascorbata]
MSVITETQKSTAMAFFQASLSRVWDFAVEQGGEWRTRQNGQTLAQLRDVFPDMELIATATAIDMENDQFRSPWCEINEARYIDQLETQRVIDWCRSNGGESFRSQEIIGGDVTSIFFRREGRFFECSDVDTLTHCKLVAQIEERFFAGDSVNFGH